MNANDYDCQRMEEILSDYLEGTLDEEQSAAAAAHAAACRQCGSLLADISAIRRDAAALPVLHPSRDLWEGIAGRIAPEVIDIGDARNAAGHSTGDRSARRRFAQPAWLAAAAAILVIVTATATWLITASGGQPGHLAGNGAGANGGGTDVAFVVASVEQPYVDEISMLRALVQERRSDLDSATVAVIERNLAIIENAVMQSRQALARDTTSRFLRAQLNSALERKVELLRTAALLPSRT